VRLSQVISVITTCVVPFLAWYPASASAVSVDTPPTVAITSPMSFDQVSHDTTVDVVATDDTEVVRVVVFVDGKKIGEDTTSPYSVIWDTRSVPNGQAVLTAQAVDASQQVGKTVYPTVVFVDNP
jgi:hypothetical protein